MHEEGAVKSPVPIQYTVDDAIEHAGMGRFQITLFLLSGVLFSLYSTQLMMLGFLLPVLQKHWDLDKNLAVPMVGCSVFIGTAVGSSFFGWFTDRFGRRKIIFVYNILAGILSVLSACAPHWLLFLAARMLCGFAVAAGQTPVTLMTEFLPTKYRGVLALCINIFWTLGALAETGLAWIMLPTDTYTIGSTSVATWRVFLIIISIPLFLAPILVIWIPESARFLTVSERYEEAEQILQWMFKWNKVEPLPGTLCRAPSVVSPIEVSTPSRKSSKFIELWAKGMWKFTVAMSWVWFANSLVYYGVIVMTPEYFSVGGGKTTYPAVFLATLAELPSFIVCGIMINYIGRKITLAANFILCGVFVMCLMIPGPLWLSTIFAVFARMFITGCYNSTAAFTREVFPTVIRNSGTGFCISMSYVASIVTLFIGTSLLNYSLWACVAVYTGFAAIGALCSMLVPVETSGKALSDNIVPHLSEPIPPKQIDLPEDVVEELPELKRVQTI